MDSFEKMRWYVSAPYGVPVWAGNRYSAQAVIDELGRDEMPIYAHDVPCDIYTSTDTYFCSHFGGDATDAEVIAKVTTQKWVLAVDMRGELQGAWLWGEPVRYEDHEAEMWAFLNLKLAPKYV